MKLKNLFLFIVGGLSLILISCAEEVKVEGGKKTKLAYMDLNPITLSTSIPVRIIVAKSTNGQILENDYPAEIDPVSGRYRIKVSPGKMRLYVLSNEPARLATLLNDIENESELHSIRINFNEIPEIEDLDESGRITNIPAMTYMDVDVRTIAGEEVAEVSRDGGVTWNKSLPISLERLASKLSFGIRKKTENPLHTIKVEKVELLNVPEYGYLIPKPYDKNEKLKLTLLEAPAEIILTENYDESKPDTYSEVFSDLLIPEYIIKEKNDAVTIRLHIVYNDIKKKVYDIPINNGTSQQDYNLLRNNQYGVLGTVKANGIIVSEPKFEYIVTDWNNVSGKIKFDDAVTFNSSWNDDVQVNGNNVTIENNQYVEFNFTLAYPENAVWKATITNPIDFEFDVTDGAVDTGVTNPGIPYKIRIKPTKAIQVNSVNTEFYITVDSGRGPIEIDLAHSGEKPAKRFIITQTSN